MKKLLFTFLIAITLFVAFAGLNAYAEEENALVISKDTDSIRYGKTVAYTAYFNGTVPDGELMWFVNDVKQEETGNVFTYTHKGSGQVEIYAKYGAYTSNRIEDSINYTLLELLVYYGLAVLALAGGIPLLVALSRRDHRSPLDIAYAENNRLLSDVCRLVEQLDMDKKIREIRLIRLSIAINSAADAALLASEDTQIAVLQIANDKLREAYSYIHGIKTAMPKDQKLEKALLAKQRLVELKEAFETIVTPVVEENEID